MSLVHFGRAAEETVGQAIGFCGLPSAAEGRRHKTIACPTAKVNSTECSLVLARRDAAAWKASRERLEWMTHPKSVEMSLDAADNSVCATSLRGFMTFFGAAGRMSTEQCPRHVAFRTNALAVGAITMPD